MGRTLPYLALLITLGALPARTSAAPPDPALPIRHHVVEVVLDVPGHRLEASDVIRIAPGSDREPLRFLLHRSLAIGRIEILGTGQESSWMESAGWDPRHFWRRPPYGELDGFDVAREVTVSPPESGWGSGEARIRVEYAGVIADSLESPERAYGRSFRTTTGRIVEKGAFLYGGSFWVPWSGDGLFAFDLTVDGPGPWRVISQGDLAREEESAGRRVTRWICPDPTEEIHLIAGPYERREREHGGLRVMAYVYADTGPDITDPYLEATGPILDRFAELFGPYPYGKFALVENYWQTGYGMPSFTFLGDRVIRLPFILHTSYPHEILHNWWGNGVYVRGEEGNWCEGLTTYCADYLAKERESEAAASAYRRSTLQGYRDFAAEGGRDFALVHFRERDSAATQAVGYGKTLMVFHMLRRRLGDEAFFGALRRLYGGHKFRRAGWDDLRTAFEEETGEALGEFFDQWVRRPGAARLSLEDVTRERAGSGFRLRGVLRQEDPPYDLRVPVFVQGAEASETLAVRCRGAETPFDVEVDFEPRRVEADAGFDLFRLLHPEEVATALSGVLGAASARIVLGGETSGELREALSGLAREWAKDSTIVLVEEGTDPLGEFEGATWFFGRGAAADAFRARDLPASDVVEASGTLVAAGNLGGRPDRPAALFLPRDAESVPGVARKVPHYSKYSYLMFDGTRNVRKGRWDPGESPLTFAFPEGGPDR